MTSRVCPVCFKFVKKTEGANTLKGVFHSSCVAPALASGMVSQREVPVALKQK